MSDNSDLEAGASTPPETDVAASGETEGRALNNSADSAAAEPVGMTAAEEAWDIAKTVMIAVGVTLLFRFFFFQPFNIPSGSMKPTLLVGDFILVDKIEYGYSKASLIYPLTRAPLEGRMFGNMPERGEIAVFKNAADRNKDYIKRVIGLPGETIQMINGVVHIDGVRVERELVNDAVPQCDGTTSNRLNPAAARVYRETLPNGKTYIVQECAGVGRGLDNTAPQTVPAGHYFLMGDNRDNSADSRTDVVGFVPFDQLVGKATRVAFSVDGQKSKIWEVWNWPGAIRYNRLLDRVEQDTDR